MWSQNAVYVAVSYSEEDPNGVNIQMLLFMYAQPLEIVSFIT